jgi:hypothetical protein
MERTNQALPHKALLFWIEMLPHATGRSVVMVRPNGLVFILRIDIPVFRRYSTPVDVDGPQGYPRWDESQQCLSEVWEIPT